MSHTAEETEQYERMMYNLTSFEKIKKTLSKTKCSVHNKKLKMDANYEHDYSIDILISKYCCVSFAEEMAKPFIDAEISNTVTIEKQ